MAEQTVATTFAVIITIISGALAMTSYFDWYRRRREYWAWIKLLYCAVGLYWGAVYVYVLFPKETMVDSIWFGRTYIRPAMLFTIGVMLAGSIIGARRKRDE